MKREYPYRFVIKENAVHNKNTDAHIEENTQIHDRKESYKAP